MGDWVYYGLILIFNFNFRAYAAILKCDFKSGRQRWALDNKTTVGISLAEKSQVFNLKLTSNSKQSLNRSEEIVPFV